MAASRPLTNISGEPVGAQSIEDLWEFGAVMLNTVSGETESGDHISKACQRHLFGTDARFGQCKQITEPSAVARDLQGTGSRKYVNCRPSNLPGPALPALGLGT